MASDDDIYNKYFFDRAYELASPSAGAFVDILMKHFAPKSVIDVGCGTGIYLQKFLQSGVDAWGYDSSHAAISASPIRNRIRLHDLRRSLLADRKFDICLCIEVAEHLPFESADVLIGTLTRLSDIIIFTAAVPGQGSPEIGHINEQPHEFWIGKFEKFSFGKDEGLTEKLREEMKSKKVIWWIVNNLMIFKNNSKL